MKTCLLTSLVGIAILQTCAMAEDWTRFRGPNGSAVSESAVPVEFNMETNLAWKKELPGRGVSSPIVVGDKVFVTTYSGYGVPEGSREIEDLKRHLVCFNKETGEELWKKTVDADTPEDPYSGAGVPAHGYASHTPVSDGEHVFCFFGKSGVVAFTMDGEQVWKKSVGKESGRRRWGSASSPIVHGDVVIVTASDESEAVVGLNKKTGKEEWRAEASGFGSTWGTPVLMEVDGKDSTKVTEVVLAVPREIWAINAKDGKLRWYAPGTDSASHSLIPGDGVVYSIGGRSGSGLAVKVGGKDDVGEAAVQWKTRVSGRFASPVKYKDVIFQVSGGVLVAINAETGEKIKESRIPGASSSRGGRGGSSRGGRDGGDRGDRGGQDGGDRGGRGRDGGGRDGGLIPTSFSPQQGRGGRGGSGGGQRGGRGSGFGGGLDYASPIVAGGKLYVTMGSGKIHVFEANKECKLVKTNDLGKDTSGFAASPAVSDGKLFIRSHSTLYCFESK